MISGGFLDSVHPPMLLWVQLQPVLRLLHPLPGCLPALAHLVRALDLFPAPPGRHSAYSGFVSVVMRLLSNSCLWRNVQALFTFHRSHVS